MRLQVNKICICMYALDGKFQGVGTLELSNPPGWGRKRRTNAPSSVNTAISFLLIAQSNSAFLSILMSDFFSINVFLCNSTRILIKTSRHVACENIRFSSLFAAGDVPRETSPAAKSEEKRMFSQATRHDDTHQFIILVLM